MFAAAVQNGADPDLPDVRHGELITRLVDAVHTSLTENRPVRI